MNSILALQCSLLLLAGAQAEKKQAAGDSLTYVEAAKEELRIVKAATEIMATATDKKSSAAASEKLRALRKDGRAYWLKIQNFPDEPVRKLSDEFLKEGDTVSMLFRSELARIHWKQNAPEVMHEIHALVLAMTCGCDSKEELQWRWSDEKANPNYCVKKHLQDYDAELFFDKERDRTVFNIRDKNNQKVIYSNDGNGICHAVIFTRWQDNLFLAEFCPMATGCSVIALDLKTGKTLWKAQLFGIFPRPEHSKYSNGINIETDGKRVIVYGKEDYGNYAEHLDINTGKTLASWNFYPDRVPQKKQ